MVLQFVSVALGVGALLGAGMGILIQVFRQPAFLVTLAGMFLARGGAFWISTENLVALTDITGYRTEFLKMFGFGLPGIDYDAEIEPHLPMI